MKQLIFITLLYVVSVIPAFSQRMDCKSAVDQLQTYANQVNTLYYQEYNYIIPNQRCPAFTQWGQVNPVIVQNCRLQMLSYLNTWYGQQCISVNTAYNQIINSCLSQADEIDADDTPAPKRINRGKEENDNINTDKIAVLEAGVDEDKSVTIRIPKTVNTYQPR